jgi:hypothetical protein
MAATDKVVVVPSENPSSCFKREDFTKQSFSVDSFVTSRQGSVSLDAMKNDLEEYLKSLKHALIELINQDYADFVNLSTNLVSTCTHMFKVKLFINLRRKSPYNIFKC